MPYQRNGKIKWSKLLNFSFSPPKHNELPSEGFPRTVHIANPERNAQYPSNWVSTTKYNLVTFFPKALFEQFRRVANLYFLVAAVISATPLSPFSASSLIAPLVFVVGVSMVKEAIEDWYRFLQDKEVNNRQVLVYDAGEEGFVQKAWKNVRVGDIVKVQKDNFFPADLLLLCSAFEDGVCYVETTNLDGETNLKMKIALECTLYLVNETKLKSLKAHIACENPNPHLYHFTGNLSIACEDLNLNSNGNLDIQYQNVCSLKIQQILLRASKLKNTDHIYGAVIFTGHDTKIMQNAISPPSKRSNIERKMDLLIYFLFTVLVLIAIVGSVVFGIITGKSTPKWWYLKPNDGNAFFNPRKPFVAALLHFVTALVLYGYFIPISLYVSIEIVKVAQAYFINRDFEMICQERHIPAHARTSNLNEELGQVATILSDKTGTLTCNRMEFVKCSIAGVSYGEEVTEVEASAAKRKGKSFPADVFNAASRPASAVKGFNFYDKRFIDNRWMQEPTSSEIQMFLRILAVCHTVVPDEDVNGNITYLAESPDEEAFVVAARELGFELMKRTQSSVWVKEPGHEPGKKVTRRYKILQLLEFSSERKRMSVIVKDEEDSMLLFCKGSDSVIFERLGKDGRKYLRATECDIEQYAAVGLRTLAIAYRTIEPSEYEYLSSLFMKTKSSVAINRDANLTTAADLIENDLMLIGATAVEDKLQEGVPECIHHLALAGIKIWVLTGDKLQTAIDIGFACNLLRQDMVLMVVTLENKDVKGAEASGDARIINNVSLDSTRKQLEQCTKRINDQKDAFFALVIDGKTLSVVLDKDKLYCQLMEIATKCVSVICCRVSPIQKAMITELVKRAQGGITLAVGDGGNDVGMIQTADIGVGIAGVEGMQASMASDFSIAQFKYLERLLLVHGSWCYKRIAHVICYFVYKNVLFGFTLFYFEAFAVFSAQTAYNDWYSALFNVVFTSLPVIAMGVLEQDLTAKLKLQFPGLYEQGIKNMCFDWKRIMLWVAIGVGSSAIIFFLSIGSVGGGLRAFRRDGRVADAEVVGMVLYTSVVWTANCQLALTLKSLTQIQTASLVGSILLWYLFLVIYGAIPPVISTTAYKVLVEACATAPSVWLALLLVVVTVLVPSFIYISVQRTMCPADDQVVWESHGRSDGVEGLREERGGAGAGDGDGDGDGDGGISMALTLSSLYLRWGNWGINPYSYISSFF